MATDFPITRPTTEDEFQRALRALVMSTQESDIDPGIGHGFRTNGNGWSIEVVRLKSSDEDPSDSG